MQQQDIDTVYQLACSHPPYDYQQRLAQTPARCRHTSSIALVPAHARLGRANRGSHQRMAK